MKNRIFAACLLFLPLNIFASSVSNGMAEQSKDIVLTINSFLNIAEWNGLQSTNKYLHDTLKAKSVRLSMDLSGISDELKVQMRDPQSKRSRRTRALYQVNFYHNKFGKEVEVRSLSAYVGNGYGWRDRLPLGYNFNRVSIDEGLKIPQHLGTIKMIVTVIPSPYSLITDEVPVVCGSYLPDIHNLEAIKIVGGDNPKQDCQILVREEQ